MVPCLPLLLETIEYMIKSVFIGKSMEQLDQVNIVSLSLSTHTLIFGLIHIHKAASTFGQYVYVKFMVKSEDEVLPLSISG